MIVLGLALAVVALLVVLFVGIGGGDTVTISAFGVDVTAASFVVFLSGAATLLVLLVGLWMIRWGVTRYTRTRTEIQRLRRIEAEVEARQIAELSRDPDTSHGRPTVEEPVPTHHTPAPPERATPREDGETRDDAAAGRTGTTRPFEKDPAPSGATVADTARIETADVTDGNGERDNRRL